LSQKYSLEYNNRGGFRGTGDFCASVQDSQSVWTLDQTSKQSSRT
jgi:hypothetical protein